MPAKDYKEKKESQASLSFFDTAGFSMWPFLQEGERLIIKKVPPADLRIGDIILYRANSQLVCHRLIKKIKQGRGYLLFTRGDNSNVSGEPVTEQMFLGKAIGIIKDGRTVNLSTRRQQLISRLIVIIAPLVSAGVRIGKILLLHASRCRLKRGA